MQISQSSRLKAELFGVQYLTWGSTSDRNCVTLFIWKLTPTIVSATKYSKTNKERILYKLRIF